MNYCFTFVCQPGELEIKSLLLAASLKRYLRGDYECVAAIPQPVTRWGDLSATTTTLLSTLGVRTVPITNRIAEDYPIGNKVAALGIETPADRVVFLDSDILCLRDFSPDTWFQAPFNAKPADLAILTYDVQRWQKMYRLVNLPLPTWRQIATVSGELMLPYFNAGVIAIQNGLGFAQVWEECCRLIEADDTITDKRPWLDQFGLPVALTQLNLPHHSLDERLNYPAHLKPLPAALPFLCHYHWPAVLRREPRLNQLVSELADTYPLLKAMLLASPDWAILLAPYTLHKARRRLLSMTMRPKKAKYVYPRPEAIITGIPRSGTSYLCRLLHTLQDCVVINEPIPIYAPLTQSYYPWQVATYYQEVRRDILDGQPVENKIHQGQIIEDTAIMDVRTRYQPTVSRPDFLLATKNTLAYLARLPHLTRVMPHAPIIACVRHPLDTIASWKTTFPHLQHAQVTEFPVGHPEDPGLSHWQRQRLAEIVSTPREAVKRALLWRYLAECLLMNRQQLLLIHYEDFVQTPVTILQTILQQIPHAPPFYRTEKIIPSTIRQKREVLDAEDRQAIFDICGQSAIELGYEIE